MATRIEVIPLVSEFVLASAMNTQENYPLMSADAAKVSLTSHPALKVRLRTVLAVAMTATITGDYTCPKPNSLVYITASGGDPGLGSNNSAIVLAAPLG